MNWKSIINKSLIKAILAIKTANEARRFLRDLMTEKEIGEFARRLKVAEMLTEKVPYSIIENETGLSSDCSGGKVAQRKRWWLQNNYQKTSSSQFYPNTERVVLM
ncbi:hypothetical protein HY061_01335 [Candidatus Azambacteria bacterium]|nr:hypothetical protein [Candidatus Azambacteria bacterium]